MLEGIFWIFVAFVIFAPAFVGLYLLVTSADKLEIKYQNFQLERTHMPLKDEDFTDMPRVIKRLKAIGCALILFSVMVAIYVAM